MLTRLKAAVLNPKNAVRNRIMRHFDLGQDTEPALMRLRTNNFSPAHIFDVGAYQGDFAKMCRRVWPNAKLTCFEVLPHPVKELREWSRRDGQSEVFECLLGGEVRDVPFHESEMGSSILGCHTPHTGPIGVYPMRTIDDVIAHSNVEPPTFLKLDVQGYECEILKGAKNTLPHVEAILTEVNFLDVYKGAPLLAELSNLLMESGFVAYDICGFWRRPLDAALFQGDFIFVPINSPLRADKRWSE